MNKFPLSFLLGLALVFGSGCSDDDDDDATGDDDTTQVATQTPAGDDDSSDSGVISPTPTPTPIPNPLTTVEIWPGYMKIDTASSFSYSARGFLRDGEEVPVVVDQWSSTNNSVATVDSTGKVVVAGTGTTFISATVGDVTSTQAQLEVVEPGTLTVQVVDADSRQPIPDADVYLGLDGTNTQKSDSQGQVIFTGDFSGAQTVTARNADHHLATVVDVISRNITVPLRSFASTKQAKFSGEVDFSHMGDIGVKDIRVGLITRSFFGNPLSLDTATVIGANRKVELCGATTYLPSNIVGEVSACPTDPTLLHYAVPGPTGTYDSYLLAGDLSLNEVLGWVTDPDIFTNLGKLLLTIDNLYDFGFYIGKDITINAPAETTDVGVAPDGKTNASLDIEVPLLPNGIDAEYPPVAFAIADMGERGYLPIGINGAVPGSTASVFHPPLGGDLPKEPVIGLVMACDQGVGHDGAYVAVGATQTTLDEKVAPPPFMDLLHDKSTDPVTRTFSVLPIDGAMMYRSIFTFRGAANGGDLFWDMYQPGQDSDFVLPNIPYTPAIKDINWEFYAYDNGEVYTFDVFTGSQTLNAYDSTIYLQRISRNKIYHIAM